MSESVVGPWAKEKLAQLRKYLHAYTTIMQKQTWCIGYHYIDAFAGPGAHVVRRRRGAKNEAQQALFDVARFASDQEELKHFIAGSPQIALGVVPSFTSYLFIERSPSRVAALEVLKAKYEDPRKIRIVNTDCGRYLSDRVANSRHVDWSRNRAIVFLDPFGMQVYWEMIKDLASTNAIEIFLNFPVGMAIQRLLPKRAADLTDARVNLLNAYFSTTEWRLRFYESRRMLFDDDDQAKIEHSGKTIVRWYRERLQLIFGHVSSARLIRNTRGGPLYYLLLATHNPTGVRIANDILRAGEVVK